MTAQERKDAYGTPMAIRGRITETPTGKWWVVEIWNPRTPLGKWYVARLFKTLSGARRFCKKRYVTVESVTKRDQKAV